MYVLSSKILNTCIIASRKELCSKGSNSISNATLYSRSQLSEVLSSRGRELSTPWYVWTLLLDTRLLVYTSD